MLSHLTRLHKLRHRRMGTLRRMQRSTVRPDARRVAPLHAAAARRRRRLVVQVLGRLVVVFRVDVVVGVVVVGG